MHHQVDAAYIRRVHLNALDEIGQIARCESNTCLFTRPPVNTAANLEIPENDMAFATANGQRTDQLRSFAWHLPKRDIAPGGPMHFRICPAKLISAFPQPEGVARVTNRT